MSVTTSSLVVVSNRLPFTVGRQPDGEVQRVPAAGGLVTAVAPVVLRTRGLWVGWPGPHLARDQAIPEADPSDLSPTAGLLSRQVVPVHLTDQVRSHKLSLVEDNRGCALIG